jgi:hypothetical protein
MIIYDYLDLPPVKNSIQCEGLVLSCTAACKEAREAAAHQLSRRLSRFQEGLQKGTGLETRLPKIPLEGSWKDIKSLTIELSAAAMHWHIFNGHIQSVLEISLDYLTIVFKGAADDIQSVPLYGTWYPVNLSKGLYRYLKAKPTSFEYRGTPSCFLNSTMPKMVAAGRSASGFMHQISSVHSNIAKKMRNQELWRIDHGTVVRDEIFCTRFLRLGWDLRTTSDETEDQERPRTTLLRGKVTKRHYNFGIHDETGYQLVGENGLVGVLGIGRWGEPNDMGKVNDFEKVPESLMSNPLKTHTQSRFYVRSVLTMDTESGRLVNHKVKSRVLELLEVTDVEGRD